MTRADVAHFIENVSEKRGWKVLQDKQLLNDLVDGLYTNFLRYGFLQCPCRDHSHKTKDRDIACPCAYSHADIKEYGHCYCGLFMSPEFSASGKDPESIPERRESIL